MNPTATADTKLAARGAFAGSALFVALIVVFSKVGAEPSATPSRVPPGQHLV